MLDPFVCEYCNKKSLVITEDPFYNEDYDLVQRAYCEKCNREFDFIFSLNDIEEYEIDEEYEE